MKEIQKVVFLDKWLVDAIGKEAQKHHRTWMREAQAILEEKVLEARKAEEPVETK